MATDRRSGRAGLSGEGKRRLSPKAASSAAVGPAGGGTSLRARFDRHLRNHPGLIPPGARVLVAFSGGPDSTALLDLLRSQSDARRLTLRAAHFDHGLRPESEREAERAARRARDLDVDCVVSAPSDGPEPDPATCRRARYDFLRREADRWGADRIATGHQADDQVETVLFRILRGTGLRGLRAIPPRRGSVVRPLLPFHRRELQEYLGERGLAWIRDPSNLDPGYSRSRIRHELLPALDAAWDGDARQRLWRLAERARRVDAVLDRLAREVLSSARIHDEAGRTEPARLLREPVLRAGREVQARVVRLLARRRNVRLDRGGTRSAVEFINDGASGGRVDVGGGLQLGRDFDTLWLGDSTAGQGARERLRIPPESSGRARVCIGGRELRVDWAPDGPPAGAHRLAIPESFRQVALWVRAREPGDRIRLAGGIRKVKDVLTDRRVPASWRDRMPVLAEGPGEILWIPGVAVSTRLEDQRPPMAWIALRGTRVSETTGLDSPPPRE